jgi:hypothetical protein
LGTNSAAGNFNLSIIKDNEYGYSLIYTFKVKTYDSYKFPGMEITRLTASLLTTPPLGKQIRGVIIYFHPTIFGKYNAPSQFPE